MLELILLIGWIPTKGELFFVLSFVLLLCVCVRSLFCSLDLLGLCMSCVSS